MVQPAITLGRGRTSVYAARGTRGLTVRIEKDDCQLTSCLNGGTCMVRTHFVFLYLHCILCPYLLIFFVTCNLCPLPAGLCTLPLCQPFLCTQTCTRCHPTHVHTITHRCHYQFIYAHSGEYLDSKPGWSYHR